MENFEMMLLIVAVILLLLMIFDLAKVFRLTGPIPMLLWLPFAANLPLVVWKVIMQGNLLIFIVLMVESAYILLKLNIEPVHDGLKTGLRLKALMGARTLIYAHIYIFSIQLLFLPISFLPLLAGGTPALLLTTNIVYSLIFSFILFLNGILRAFICSRRLRLVRRVLILITLWIPVVNWIMWIFTARLMRQEYLFYYERWQWEETLEESDLCKTKYPLLFVHGLAFRDMRFFNYWGRVPRFLKKYGADIYYGNQEGLGTIERNGEDLCERIHAILAETGAEKVNIIAHSKGGLDARYAISTLGMADKVASLTTMNTPHRGCRFADHATKLSPGIYRKIARILDVAFTRYGDKHPDFYAATMQFRTTAAAEFNSNCPDAPGVYYQSCTSIMSGPSSDRILSIPYRYIKKLGEENDGLVSVESAKWGVFRGVFRNRENQIGISHGDIIDLKRSDYEGFSVFSAYMRMIADLKARGF
jgi:triacylglycerol lipase